MTRNALLRMQLRLTLGKPASLLQPRRQSFFYSKLPWLHERDTYGDRQIRLGRNVHTIPDLYQMSHCHAVTMAHQKDQKPFKKCENCILTTSDTCYTDTLPHCHLKKTKKKTPLKVLKLLT
jgi:hypothetical protein